MEKDTGIPGGMPPCYALKWKFKPELEVSYL